MATSHKATLTWVAPVDGDPVVSYNIKRATVTSGVAGAFVVIGNVPATALTYVDTNVVAGGQYAYEVTSVNAAGESAPTAIQVVTVPLGVPQAPTNLTVVAS